MLTQKTINGERKTGNGLQKTPANGGIDRRESYHFPQINGGGVTKEDRKGKRDLFRTGKNKGEHGRVEGETVKNLASKPPSGRQSVSERATYDTQLAHGMDVVVGPVETTSKPSGESPGKSRDEN